MTQEGLRVNVITSCTGRKLPLREGEQVPAERLYLGQQHVRLMRGVDRLRAAGARVDVWVVSAGFGLVQGAASLPAYEQTFQGRRVLERRRMARGLGIPAAVRHVLALEADLTLMLLGDTYLEACELDRQVRVGAPVLLVASASAAVAAPPIPGVRVVGLATEDTRRFGAGFIALKGEVGGRLLERLADGDGVAEVLGTDVLTALAARSRPAVEHAVSPLF